MTRGRAAGTAAVLVLLAVVVAGGAVYLRTVRGGGADVGPTVPSVLRNPDSTVYTAPSGIFFATGSASLDSGAVPALQAIASDVRASRFTGKIVVEGHTDDVGSDQLNLSLSHSRAQTVADWLVDEGGLDASRIEVVGVGESSPAEPNDSDAHRRANRRVVIAVMRAPGTTPAATPPATPTGTPAATANG